MIGHGPASLLADSLIGAARDEHADLLNDLDDDDDKDHAHPDHVGLGTLVAIDDGDLAEAGAADGGGHGAVAEDGDGDYYDYQVENAGGFTCRILIAGEQIRFVTQERGFR